MAQAPAFKHYNHDNGLAANTCYQLFQNARGYIWVATESGASRFDGLQFRNYSISNGLADNEIIAVDEMADSSLIIASYSKGINSIKNNLVSDTVFNYPIGRIKTLVKNKNTIYLQGSDGVYLFKRSIPKNGKAVLVNHLKDIQLTNKAIEHEDNFYTILNDQLFNCADTGLQLIKLPIKEKISCVSSDNRMMYVCAGSKMYLLDKFVIKKQLNMPLPPKSTMNKLIAIDANNLWMVVDEHYLYYYNGQQLVLVSNYFDLENTRINDIMKDRENNIWVSTNGKGVYFLYNFFISNFKSSSILASNIITDIECHKGQIGFATAEGVSILKSNRFEVTSTRGYNYRINHFDNKWLVCNATSVNNTNEISFINATTETFKSDSLYVASANQIFVYKNNEVIKKYYFPKDFSARVQSLLLDYSNQLWAGTKAGLFRCKLSDSLLKPVFQNNKILRGTINCLVQDESTKHIWIGTNNGLSVINTKNEASNYFEVGKHTIEQVKDLVVINGRVWLASNRGLFQIGTNLHLLNFFDKNTGIINDNISSLVFDTTYNELWVGTEDGVSMLSFNNLPKPSITALPRVEYLTTSDSTYVFPNNLYLPKRYNSLKIRFSTPSYTNTKNILYKYKLDDGPFLEGLDNEIILSGMHSGKHSLTLQACNVNGIWSNPKVFNFEVYTPFWATTFFKILLTAVGLLFILSIYKFYNKRIKAHKEEAAKQLQRATTWKQNAILVQQHNHLQIEAFENTTTLHKADENHAKLYFSMFTNFNEEYIRQSKELFITLEDEIKLSELYLEIEQARIPGSFTFSFTIDEEIVVQAYKVPNFIIIPFLRNAIWHSLHYNSGQHGHINIAIQQGADDQLIISIVDDGIGIKAAAFFKQKQSILQDMEGVKTRLELLSTESNKSSVKLTDLGEINGDDQGTLVVITLKKGTIQKN